MKYLVFCNCGHGLDRHASDGCGGDGRTLCPCLNDQEDALESAIEQARRNPWGAARIDDAAEIA
jgi:hypothetical protein